MSTVWWDFQKKKKQARKKGTFARNRANDQEKCRQSQAFDVLVVSDKKRYKY